MKKIIIFLLSVTLIACNKRKFNDANDYTKAIVNNFYIVQKLNDSLQKELLSIKNSLELEPFKTYCPDSFINCNKIRSLHTECLNKTKKSKTNIERLYFENDTIFKKGLIIGLNMIEKNLTTNVAQLIDTLCTKNGYLNMEIINIILPIGKTNFQNYQAAFDTIAKYQLIFDAQNKYSIDSKLIIRFAF